MTLADLDAGSVTNHATAHGTPAGGSLVPPTDQATAHATQNPALTVEKTSPDTTFAAPGDVLDYSYTVTNSGNVTLTGPFTVGRRQGDRRDLPGQPDQPRPGCLDHLHRDLHRDPGRHRRGLGDQRRQRLRQLHLRR